VLRAIDEAFHGQRRRLTPRQLDAIRTWQRTDRSYELVQAILRGTLNPAALAPGERRHAEMLIADLDDAIASWHTAHPLTVYRGIRSLVRAFGVKHPNDLPNRPTPRGGFTAASVHRHVALTEFVGPGGALLELELPAGTPALWVAGVGDRRLRRQGEVLLQDRLELRITDVRHDGEMTVLSMAVIA
jgi:hypothetical protein